MKPEENKKTIRVALAGNPNTGKTSIFNNLTGSSQYVGNWPGVTVEKKEGEFQHRGYRVQVVDLPGIYGFSAYSLDEKIARNFLLEHGVDLVINVVDATNLERNLYLNLEFRELGLPMIVALNMMDELAAKKKKINKEILESYLGADFVETVARKGRGMYDLKDRIVDCFEKGCRPGETRFEYPREVREEIEKIASFLKKQIGGSYGYSLKWLAVEFLEQEQDVIDKFNREKWFPELSGIVAKSVSKISGFSGQDAGDFIISSKYSFLKGLVKEVVEKDGGEKKGAPLSVEERLELSDRIDRVVLNSFLGVPVFLFVMFLVFFLTFFIGNPVADLIDGLIGALGAAVSSGLDSAGAPSFLRSLLVDGIIGGVGAVVVFLPNILMLFLLIAALEDSGYMARAAFVMDRFMHLIGLHGKSFIPMIIGFGCNVPAIMAARTLENRKDRILTILTIPFMSCSARMPVYILFTSAFFEKNQALVVWGLYMAGIIAGAITALAAKNIAFKKEETPLIMEMPPYRMPQLKSLGIHAWYRGKMFLQKAGTVILAGVVIIWLLSSLPPGVEYASEKSALGMLGKIIAPVFAPAGFDIWQAAVALITGVLAKEIIVGTLGALFGAEGIAITASLASVFTPLSGLSFMVFILLYIPCVPTIAVIRGEAGKKWAWLIVVYTFAVAWAASTAVYQVGRLLGY